MAMFSNNNNVKETKKEVIELSNSSTIIGKGATLEGNIDTIGNVRVEGKIIGNIKSKAKVAFGESAEIEGVVSAQNAEIAGRVKGFIEVSEVLILKATAVIDGDIVAGRLIIETGASFNGSCKMGSVTTATFTHKHQEQEEVKLNHLPKLKNVPQAQAV